MADETKNVILSLIDRVGTELEPDYSIHYPDTEFNADALAEWLQVAPLSAVPRGTPEGGRHEAWMLDINCFHKISDRTTDSVWRIWELVDVVRTAFGDVAMAVKDWADPALPTLFYVRWDEGTPNKVPQMASTKGAVELQQVNVSFKGVLIA